MTILKEIRNYVTDHGKEPFEEWLCDIKDKIVRARIRHRLDRLMVGYYGDYKYIGGGICELRLKFGPGYRIYFCEEGQATIVLLCGGDKSTQIVDILRAQRYANELQKKVSNE